MKKALSLSTLVLTMAAAVVACSGGDGLRPTVTPGTPPPDLAFAPPFEGPERASVSQRRTNYREEPDFQLPSPDTLSEPPRGTSGPEFRPPEEPQCPQSWNTLSRPREGFSICYPDPWIIEGHGYVTAGADDRWYSVGLFLFDGDLEAAHVSIYITNPYARPFLYTRECEQAYRVAFVGEPAVLCPDYPGVSSEARIIAYHLRRGDLDYFVNVVPHYEYDAQAFRYLDAPAEEVEARAIQIAHTFNLIEITEPSPP